LKVLELSKTYLAQEKKIIKMSWKCFSNVRCYRQKDGNNLYIFLCTIEEYCSFSVEASCLEDNPKHDVNTAAIRPQVI